MCPDMATLDNKLGEEGEDAAEQLDTVDSKFNSKMSLDLDLEFKNLLGRDGGAARESLGIISN
jgi:hypothetical protein